MYKVKVTYTEGMRFDNPTDILLCDPCYIFSNDGPQEEAWQEMCEQMFNPRTEEGRYPPQSKTGIAEFYDEDDNLKLKFIYSGTAYGDGCYRLKSNLYVDGEKDLGVDAGLLAVIPLHQAEEWKKMWTERDVRELGGVIKGYDRFIELDGKGNIFGFGFSIYTDGSDEICDNCGEQAYQCSCMFD